jgi:hypothetical protein
MERSKHSSQIERAPVLQMQYLRDCLLAQPALKGEFEIIFSDSEVPQCAKNSGTLCHMPHHPTLQNAICCHILLCSHQKMILISLWLSGIPRQIYP